ncbi:hypothetical protein [Erythrobacter litoralis]|uniref:hypothetical protein n=1 Tax=Erythrobacter litoralis TaxID=39960 RepID=UPI002435F375|nr:hypothetical protein [Erythrobacter litoralis]
MIHWHYLVGVLAFVLFALGALCHFAVGMASSGTHPDETRMGNRFLIAALGFYLLILLT